MNFSLLFLATSAVGQVLVTSDINPTWNPELEPVRTGILRLENSDSNLNALINWSLSLEIVPSPSAQGMVEFIALRLPSSNYVFEGRSSGLAPTLVMPTNNIDVVGDTDSKLFDVFLGNELPAVVSAGGKNLVEIDFVASPDASGTFFLQLVEYDPATEMGSFWVPLSTFLPMAFDNSGQSTVIGQFQISSNTPQVPEPSAFWIWAIAAILSSRHFLRRIRPRR